jgi:hypothetical protein
MAVIDPNSPIVKESSETIAADFLTNLRINRFKVQEAIAALTSGGVKSYTIDTGQNVQTVTQLDLGSLRETLSTLNDMIKEEEELQGEGTVVQGQLVQVV